MGRDSNPRRPMPKDLKSFPFGRSGTHAYSIYYVRLYYINVMVILHFSQKSNQTIIKWIQPQGNWSQYQYHYNPYDNKHLLRIRLSFNEIFFTWNVAWSLATVFIFFIVSQIVIKHPCDKIEYHKYDDANYRKQSSL